MKFKDDRPEVEITVKVVDYFGAKRFPTIYANGIPIMHINDLGHIIIRNGKDTDIKELIKMGFSITNMHPHIVHSCDLRNES